MGVNMDFFTNVKQGSKIFINYMPAVKGISKYYI
jgi:hypothetical protein